MDRKDHPGSLGRLETMRKAKPCPGTTESPPYSWLSLDEQTRQEALAQIRNGLKALAADKRRGEVEYLIKELEGDIL